MIEGALRILFQITFASSLLIAVLLVLRRVFRERVRPTWQYAAWFLVLIRLLIPLHISSPASVMNIINHPSAVAVDTSSMGFQSLPYLLMDPQPYYGRGSDSAVQAIPDPNISSFIEKPQEKPDIFQMLFILWIAGAFGVFVYMALLNIVLLRRLRRSSVELELDQIPFYRDLCQQVGIKIPLPVVISRQLPSPCLVGLFRPFVAVTPEAAADRTMLRHVLLHELCHFKQKDNLFSLLRNICCTIYWFNPLVWAAAIASRDDSELSCDDLVLRCLDEKEGLEYGHTLLTLLSTCRKKAAFLNTVTTMASGKSSIKTRINIIINRPKTLKTVSAIAVGLVVLLGVMTLTGAKDEPVFGEQNIQSTAQVMDDRAKNQSDEATTSPNINEAAKRSLDMDSLRMLANGKLTLKDIINRYMADKVIQDETYTEWQYALDNGFSFDLKYIHEKNLPDRYTASLCNNDEPNYIFFPCRPESLEQFLAASAQGSDFYLQTYESFDGKKVAEIEYDETKQQAASLKVLDDGKTFTMSEAGSFGRVCWSPNSVYGAFINMTTLNGRAGGDNCAYLYNSRNHQFYDFVNPITIISAFNELGTFDKEVTEIYLHPRIQWSPDSKKLLLSCYPNINDNHVVAHLVYDVTKNKVEDIKMSDVPRKAPNGLSYWEW